MHISVLKNINTILKIFRDKEQLSNDVRVDCDEVTNIFDNLISAVDNEIKKGAKTTTVYTFPFRVEI